MIVYISGKITGLQKDVYEKLFYKYTREMQKQGYIAINPIIVSKNLECKLNREPTYAEYMKEDIKKLMECDAVCFMPNWKESKGAKLEREIARACGMKILDVNLF